MSSTPSQKSKKEINKIKTDIFGGFNPVEAYSNLAVWFVKTFGDIPADKITSNFLKSPETINEFKEWCSTTELFPVKNINSMTLINAFSFAVNYYKVLEINQNKYVLGVNLENRKSEIFKKLASKTSNLTEQQIKTFELELAKFNTEFVNNFIDSQQSSILSSAFDGMFWAMAKKTIGKNNKVDAYALFSAFSLYKRYPYVDASGKATKTFKELYELALKDKLQWPSSTKESKSSTSYKNFMILMACFGLAKSFSPTEKELDISLVEYDDKLKTYLLKPARIPTKYPFSEKEVDELLSLMKNKGTIREADKGSKKYLGKYASDPRVQKTDVDVLYEALCGFKLLYEFNIPPIELYKANFLNFNKDGNGSQLISIQDVINMKINTNFDRDLLPYNTAPGGVADIITETSDIYFTIEPCVYTNEDDILGHETNGVNHIPGRGCMILTTLKELSEKAKQSIVGALCGKNEDSKTEKRIIFATPDNLSQIIQQIHDDPEETFKEGYLLKKQNFLRK